MTRQKVQKLDRKNAIPEDDDDFVTRPPAEGKGRVILMLQGHPSRFWRQLADGLAEDGHRVLKVHFGLADAVFWGRRSAIHYRGRFSRWRAFLTELVQREGVTDIFYYADRLPYHAVALEVAGVLNRRAWAIEHGYLRPDWLTIEADGMGALSRFPRTRAEIEALAEGVSPPDMTVLYRHDFAVEAFNEVSFGLLQSFGRVLYPLHVSDRPVPPVIDYLSWLPELVLTGRRARDAMALTRRLIRERIAYNLVPLQLEVDYQIRGSSPYSRLTDFIEEVIASLARTAPADRHVVFKVHPLDNGLGRWFSRIPAIAERYGVADRVHVLRGGNLGRMVTRSCGVVLVNSTVGIHALRAGTPLCVLGTAIYDVPGLSHQGGLDRFWTQPEPVDRAFFETFERAISTIQVKGSFFAPDGRDDAIAQIRARMRPTAPVAGATGGGRGAHGSAATSKGAKADPSLTTHPPFAARVPGE
ncbi:Capsular polysaccharide export system protein KpsS [Rhodovulum sp. P5]|uniref:capsule biosynthesis protein n=1 Tax=Rhodovulum sp. P5 TaxID=1564506 RepID=UPI0009C2EDD5|nr:capsular biosynthesis protein [Rhodovulum sp. P5]ARE39410.1 Capsular polysaccharide export system protein KpsS [Rhodovulum sp. P5]